MKHIALSVLLTVATLLVGSNVATAQTAQTPLTLVSPASGETWQIGNSHRISWTPNPDSSTIDAFLELKKGKVFQTVAQLIPCAKGSIIWCGDVDTTPFDGATQFSVAKTGQYYLSVVDRLTKQTARTKNPIKLVKAGDVIKLNLVANLPKNKRVEAKNDTPLTIDTKSVTLSWQANADSCAVDIAPDTNYVPQEHYIKVENLPRHVTKRAFNLPGTYANYWVWLHCSKGTNAQTKSFYVTVKGVVANTPAITKVQAKAAEENEIFAGGEKTVLYGTNLSKDTKVYLDVGKNKYFPGVTQTQSDSINFTTFKVGEVADGTYTLYAQNGNTVSNGIEITYKNPKSSFSITEAYGLPNGGQNQLIPGNSARVYGTFTGMPDPFRVILMRGSSIITLDADRSFDNALTFNVPASLSDGSYSLQVESGTFATGVSKSNQITVVIGDIGDGTCQYGFTRDLTLGSMGSDVVSLQTFLEAKGFLVLPAGQSKGYFGASTQAALAKYQAAVGISPADGYFGPIVRAYIAAKECPPVVIADPLVVDPVETDSDSEDGIGTFTFELELTAGDEDVYVSQFSSQSADNVGFDWRIIGGASTTVSTITVQSDAEIEDGYFEIQEGNTEEFTVVITVDPMVAGSYYVILDDVSFFEDIRTNPIKTLALEPASDFDTPAVSIAAAMGPQPARTARVAADTGSYGPYSAIAGLPDLKAGMTHDGVAQIQRFLNANGFVVNATVGQPGSVGYEATYFGPATQRALAAYQASKGISPASGTFGPATRAAMAATPN